MILLVTAPGEDFPSVQQVKDALIARGIVPIFMVTSDMITTYNVGTIPHNPIGTTLTLPPPHTVQSLVSTLGFGTVVELEGDSANVVEAIIEGMNSVKTQVRYPNTRRARPW